MLLKTIVGSLISISVAGTGWIAYEKLRVKTIKEQFDKEGIVSLNISGQDEEWKKILGKGSSSETSTDDETLKAFINRNKEDTSQVTSVDVSKLKKACELVMPKPSSGPNFSDAKKYCVKWSERQ